MNSYLHHISDDSIYNELHSALKKQSLILFAGSGLSAQACTNDGRRPPLWKGLLKSVITWSLERRLLEEDFCLEVGELIEQGWLIEAGQELQDKIEPAQLLRCLKDILFHDDLQPGNAHKFIAQIPFRAYLTTNYDRLIELAYGIHHRKNLETFCNPKIDGVSEAFREMRPFMFKLHGDIYDESSIIFGTRAYERLLHTDNTYRFCLENIFTNSSVLFLGFSGSDPDIDGVTSRVAAFDGRNKRHWLLTQTGQFPKLKAARLWKDKGIRVIQYDPDPMHSGVEVFLRKLATPLPSAITFNQVNNQLVGFDPLRI